LHSSIRYSYEYEQLLVALIIERNAAQAALAARQSNQALDELAAETERLGGLYRPSDDEARRRRIISDT
jgi:hypothetical protein